MRCNMKKLIFVLAGLFISFSFSFAQQSEQLLSYDEYRALAGSDIKEITELAKSSLSYEYSLTFIEKIRNKIFRHSYMAIKSTQSKDKEQKPFNSFVKFKCYDPSKADILSEQEREFENGIIYLEIYQYFKQIDLDKALSVLLDSEFQEQMATSTKILLTKNQSVCFTTKSKAFCGNNSIINLTNDVAVSHNYLTENFKGHEPVLFVENVSTLTKTAGGAVLHMVTYTRDSTFTCNDFLLLIFKPFLDIKISNGFKIFEKMAK